MKQADLALPAPLRWLTRAFSSITLAVILLTFVCLYGALASVPLVLIGLGVGYLIVGIGTVGVAALVWYLIVRFSLAANMPDQPSINAAAKNKPLPRLLTLERVILGLILLGVSGVACVFGSIALRNWMIEQAWYQTHRATVIYRLPFFEMTELEFYAWWPMRLVLILFVINMVWATIRRIEFKFLNIGVLTVHTGIVVIALGSILYGHVKVEGDMLLWRTDIRKQFVSTFYDAFNPAIYITSPDGRQISIDTPQLPRYNDYQPGELNIPLHHRRNFQDTLGDQLRASIVGFIAHGNLRPTWMEADEGIPEDQQFGPMLRMALGDVDGPLGAAEVELVSGLPSQRAFHAALFSMEYLHDPPQQRIDDLLTPFEGSHGLIIEIPAADHRQVVSIEPGQVIEVGDTGYTVEVESIGPYDIPFVTEGYRGARDTHALVHVTGHGKAFTRMVMHRYPERSQDFHSVDDAQPPDPQAGPMMGALGTRTDPDPAIRLVYIDDSRVQYHIIHQSAHPDRYFQIIRGQSLQPASGWTDHLRMPVPTEGSGGMVWLHLVEHIQQAAQTARAVMTPKLQRDPSDEGTYIYSLVAVKVEMDRSQAQGGPWSRTVWINHMRYPDVPDRERRPASVYVPGMGELQIAFSRQSYDLPFAVKLAEFEMIPYPGSDIPFDYRSNLLIADVDERGIMYQQPQLFITRLNNPAMYSAAGAPLWASRMKLSQTGWDPGDPAAPNNNERDAEGRFTRQQRYSIIGVANNVGIRIIAAGSIMVAVGIPWAFYIKPLILHMRKQRLAEQLRQHRPPTAPQPPGHSDVEPRMAPAMASNPSAATAVGKEEQCIT